MNGFTDPAATVIARMAALADATRSRLLLALERHELTVSELCTVLQLPQSTVSRHLKVLGDEGWVESRAEGTSRLYSMPRERLDEPAEGLWRAVRDAVAAGRAAEQDARRLEGVLARRRSCSQEFFSSVAGEWDRVRAELFGRHTDLSALLALLDPDWTVADLGCGTGQVSAVLAPFVGRVIAVDDSDAMLKAARARLAGAAGVELTRGRLESLPLEAESVDAALLILALHYVTEPARAVREAARVLRPGGRLLVVDMTPHERAEYRQQMGHLWQGFAPEQVAGWAAAAGLEDFRYHALPADPEAKGPSLFAAVARKRAIGHRSSAVDQQHVPDDRRLPSTD